MMFQTLYTKAKHSFADPKTILANEPTIVPKSKMIMAAKAIILMKGNFP